MKFRQIYEAVCGTNAGGSLINSSDAIGEYIKRKIAKTEAFLERAEFEQAEREDRERMEKLNKEFLEAERARSQENNSGPISEDYDCEENMDFSDMGFGF